MFIKGSYDTGDLEFIVGDCKIFVYIEVVREGLKYFVEFMEKFLMIVVFECKFDVMKIM